ncbi:hypothetical protein GCM10018952_39960 [Streptosporangium vulgare]
MAVLPVSTCTLAMVMLSVRTPSRFPAPSPPTSRKFTPLAPPHGSSCLTGTAVGLLEVLSKMALAVSLPVSTVLAVSANGAITDTHSTPTATPDKICPGR